MHDCLKPPALRPVCPTMPVREQIKELEKYRLYIMKLMECSYKKMVEQLSAITPENLETLSEVLDEYKEIQASIDSKLTKMEEMLDSFIETYTAQSIDDLRLYFDYDGNTKNLSYRIGKKV